MRESVPARDADEIACAACTFLNPPHMQGCQMCGAQLNALALSAFPRLSSQPPMRQVRALIDFVLVAFVFTSPAHSPRPASRWMRQRCFDWSRRRRRTSRQVAGVAGGPCSHTSTTPPPPSRRTSGRRSACEYNARLLTGLGECVLASVPWLQISLQTRLGYPTCNTTNTHPLSDRDSVRDREVEQSNYFTYD